MSVHKVIEAIRRHKSFLITGHIDPEADTIGSQLALGSLLKRLDKDVRIINQDLPPESCAFLPYVKSIELVKNIKKSDFKAPDCAMVIDCPTIERAGKTAEIITDGIEVINIDHHVSNQQFGHINWVDLKAAAVGEMIFDIFSRLKMKPTNEEATAIYSAVLIDTGSFRYSNTTAKTHMTAAKLIARGLDTNGIYESLFEMRSFCATRLLGLALSTLKKNGNGAVVWIWITRRMLKRAGANFDEAENFINYARAIKGCKVAILFKEAADKGVFKVSFRSKKPVDVNKIAAEFGGGGHSRAAGCTITAAGAAAAEKKILSEVFKAV
ncbi:MAG: bifunctional oligoribonuclease/PAP phosphatase NrnA [Candidatus Omnitrophota bacterium]